MILRIENFDIENIGKPNQYQPFSWGGCVVKISDKIAYLGRDIEDAMSFKILNFGNYKELMVSLIKICLMLI
jgi:dGTPase